MPFVYINVDQLQNKPKVGGGECVRLLQHYIAGIGQVRQWRQGDPVIGNFGLTKGTAIATFKNGLYQSLEHGNHGALYISQDAGGIMVMDQWNSPNKPLISSRYIRRRGKYENGEFVQPEDNADAFSVVERAP